MLQKLDGCLQELLRKPYNSLQGYYEAMGEQPDFRFGYCCKNFAEIIVKRMTEQDCPSFTLISDNGLNSIALAIDEEARAFIASPSLFMKEPADITDVLGNPGKTMQAECYSEIPGEKITITGTQDGFLISEPFKDWASGEKNYYRINFSIEKENINRSFHAANNGKRIPRITPVITVLDFSMETPTQLSMSLGQDDVYTKDHQGNVHMNNAELENRIITIMGKGITIQDLKQYAQKCRELRNYTNRQNN
jgi:hypothetical protein